jgi:hypothetical protein
MREDVDVSLRAAGLKFLLIVERYFASAIPQHQLRCFIKIELAGAKQNVIFPIRLEKLPGSFEQLEELPHNIVVRRICNYAYHSKTV